MRLSLAPPALVVVSICTLPATAQWGESKLVPSAPQVFGSFGQSVSLRGDTLLVGASGDLPAGTVWVRERDQGGAGAWGEVIGLEPSNTTLGSGWFGYSVAMSGDWVVVGEPATSPGGTVSIFHRNQGGAGAWGLVQERVVPGALFDDWLGWSVAIDGDTLVAGMPNDGVNGFLSGSAHVFRRDQGGQNNWGEVAMLVPGDGQALNQFGYAVSINGNRIVVGAIDTNVPRPGAAYVFERNLGGPNAWGERRKIEASDGEAGDHFGTSLQLVGNTLVVGAPDEDALGPNSGSAYVFERSLGGPNAWGEAAKLVPADGAQSDIFGWAVAISLDANTIAVGAPFDDDLYPDEGAAYLFERHLGGVDAWGQLAKLEASDPTGGEDLGRSIAVDGDMLVAGAPEANAPLADSGAVYLFERVTPAAVYCTAGASASGCAASIAVSGAPSASAPSGFVVTASSVEPGANALFYFGSNGRQANPWGSGTSYQCVAPPVKRGGTLAAGGTPGECDGFLWQDLNARWTAVPAQVPSAGAALQIQAWYRDPGNTSNQTTSLSDAVEVVVGS